MANKAISELPQAQNVNNQDLFVLEQSGIAKKLTAETFITEQGIIDALAEALDGHGGIQSVMLSSVSGRIRTYRITFTDQSATTFQVYDGTSIDRISRTSSSGLDDVYTIFLSDGTTTFFTVHNGADGNVSEAMLNDALKDKAPAITETTESSAIANFTDGADNMVMHNVVAEINPVQSGSGDPSPSNIRPISGWTECNVTRTGKNLFSYENIKKKGIYRATVIPMGEDLNSFYLSGAGGSTDTPTLTVNSWAYVDVFIGFQVKEETAITVSCKVKNYTENCNGFVRVRYSTTEDRASSTVVNTVYFNTVGTFNISISGIIPSGNYVFFEFSPAGKAEIVTLTQYAEITDFQFELGSTATAYEPYIAPATASLSWQTEAGTVYGGTIDVATGLLTVTDGYYNLKNTSASNIFSYDYNGKHGVYFRYAYGIIATRDSGVCNMAHVSTEADYPASQYMWFGVNSNNVFWIGILDALNMTLEEFKTWIQSNDVYITRRLATPQTYQLSGQQLMTLLGTNNVWTDIANVSVTYPADTKMFIEKLTIPSEDDLVANQAITSGKYFMIGNSLYLALANIASGAQITIGTNAQRVSLADALNTINS